MAILKVAKLGHPVLRMKAQTVSKDELSLDATQRFIDDMIETMREYEGVGLAAPQVHVSKQIFVYEVRSNGRYPEAEDLPLATVVNPVLEFRGEKSELLWEGCLSIPDFRGVVPRAASLVCKGLDRYGKPIAIEAEDFHARILQHEWDHLQGHVYPDRMPDLQTLTYLEEFQRYYLPENGSDDTDS